MFCFDAVMTEEKLTVSKPLAKVHLLRSTGHVDEAFLNILAKVVENNIHVGLQSLYVAHRIVLGNGTLHPGMFSWAGSAKDVVCDLSIDNGTVIVVKLSLDFEDSLANFLGCRPWDDRTLSHLPSVL